MKDCSHPLLARRTSGVLLHLTCLPGPHGSGDLGEPARHFLDWLVSAGQTIWQVLPLTPTGAGHSPYQSPSAFAGSPWLVDLEDMVRQGWLAATPAPDFDPQHCDFERVLPYRLDALRQAWRGFCGQASSTDRSHLADFARQHSTWLDDYVLFMVLQERYGEPWTRWPEAYARHDAAALHALQGQARTEVDFWRFVQWRFHVQWADLREQAHARGIAIAGDAPIFVAHHSADVWANAGQYLLDEAGEPSVVAGVPPDYFSATGQRWGNPLYRWSAMAEDGYHWWKQRVKHLMSQVDLVRLDHFRAFEAHWEIPADCATAIAGKWKAGPGQAFFQSLEETLGVLPIIAEDLGIITDAVTDLRLECGFPGMRVLQFAFGDTARNPYLPHNYQPQTVAYTGTHDNDTSVGWWQQAREDERDAARNYLGPLADTEIHWAMIGALSQSVARTLLIPLQDVLGLDSAHRMNTPGQASGCWTWRFEWSQINAAPAHRLKAMAKAHGRSGG
jgi:4-alpha-glucanotransferase